jgi:hypothetical protein
MRKNVFGGLLLIGLFSLSHCKNEPSVTKEPPKGTSFNIYTEQRVIPLYPDAAGTGNKPQMTLSIDIFYPPDPLKQIVQELLYGGQAPDVYRDNLIASYENQYFEMRDVQSGEMSLNWEYTETIRLDAPLSKIMMLSRNREYYVGGAHGMREKQYFVIDTDGQKQLRLEDLIKTDAFPALNSRIEGELRVFSGIAPDEPLSQGGFFEDRVGIPENCFLTAEGLGFHWDQYEIAPYFMGPIEVLLPYGNIKDLLSERLNKLLVF